MEGCIREVERLQTNFFSYGSSKYYEILHSITLHENGEVQKNRKDGG
jgi:hypothetical protein